MLGGAEWYVYNISRELVKNGHDVHVFTAATYNGSTAAPRESIDGISVHRLPLKLDWSYRMKVWDGLSSALESEGFDLIHTYDYAQPHSASAIRVGRKSGKATVLTVFDVHSMIPRALFKQVAMKVMDRYMARKTIREASMVLARAPNLVEPIVELGGSRERIKVTSSGVRDEAFASYDGSNFRERYSVNGSPLVLYLGRLHPMKGPQFLLEATPSLIREFPEATFAFVGPDQSGFRAVLEKRANDLRVGSRILFTGMISDFKEKMEAYAACDAFVLPTGYEGTSQAVFEAMSQGKPVVTTRTGGIPYQIEDGREGFLIEYGDRASLVDRIGRVLRDRKLSSEFSRNGRLKAEEFRYSRLVEQLVEDYEEVSRVVGA